MELVPEKVGEAAAVTKTEASLSLAEAAGIRAIHAEIRKIQHERRQLGMEDQKLSVKEEETVDALESAWAELATDHGLNPSIPVTAWRISKKNKATLDPKMARDLPVEITEPAVVKTEEKPEEE